MNRYLLPVILLLLSLNLRAQDADFDKADPLVVTFNFKTQRFDKSLPFDRAFTLHFTEMEDSYEHIHIKIFKITDHSYAKRKDGKYTQEGLTKVIYELDDPLKETQLKGVKELSVNQVFHLTHSSEYYFEIYAVGKRKLTEDEKKTLTFALQTNRQLYSILNNTAIHALNNPNESSDTLIINKDKYINYFKAAVKEVDTSYVFVSPVNVTTLVNFAELRKAFQAIGRTTDYLFNQKKPKVKLAKPDSIIQAKTDSIITEINGQIFNSAVNWGTLKKNDKQYTIFQKSIDALIVIENKKGKKANYAKLSHFNALKQNIDKSIVARDKVLMALIEAVAIPNTYKLTPGASTLRSTLVNEARLYFSFDAGMAYVSRVDRVLFYSGINVYFRPVDKHVPFKHYTGWDKVAVRTSLLVGFGLSSIEKPNVRKGIFGDRALVLGGGYRLTPTIKLNAGAFCHYRYDRNPIIDPERYHFSMSPFVSLSLDLDVAPIFEGINKTLFK